eukprot:TRINITY_DN49644_c0_g1_i1.p1 TRINITY_DN49644_c0_g1~~TRINITY_DN49644_c0_g1_i1.p1  ORF type:complete len:668 (+),score=72.96 TRINITY_DN49644_c0_g1_i1:1-2004(+)
MQRMGVWSVVALLLCYATAFKSQHRSNEIDRWLAGLPVARTHPTPIYLRDVGVPHGSEKAKTRVSDEVAINSTAVLRAASNLESHHDIVKSGEEWRKAHPYDGDTFGVMRTSSNDLVYESRSQQLPLTSNNPDFTSLIHVGRRVFMISHIEDAPGGSFFLELQQDQVRGHLTLKNSTFMDWSRYGGLRFPCGGIVSPWNTHLGAEEYEPDAKRVDNFPGSLPSNTNSSHAGEAFEKRNSPVYHLRYHGIYLDQTWNTSAYKQAVKDHFNPYHLGWPFEAGPANDSYFARKLMALGRRSGEVPFVMPDKRTVYLTDDGPNTYISAFYADSASDLSSGRLYCAKAKQVSSVNGGSFELEWIDMGHTTAREIEEFVNRRPLFSDLFDEAPPLSKGFPAACPAGFNVSHESTGLQCLRVKEGMETFVSRLESRRYASMLGCTTEWNTLEGFAFSAETEEGYIAASSIEKGMEDRTFVGTQTDEFDAGTGNHVRLAANKCGCIYSLSMEGNGWFAATMTATVCGQAINGTNGSLTCASSSIANPDNIASLHGHAGLLIGEDSSVRENNLMWHYDLTTRQLKSRVASVPLAAEVCAPNFYPDIGGWATGPPGLGYVSWKRSCVAEYPDWSMPGIGSGSTCKVSDHDHANVARVWLPALVAALVVATPAMVGMS